MPSRDPPSPGRSRPSSSRSSSSAVSVPSFLDPCSIAFCTSSVATRATSSTVSSSHPCAWSSPSTIFRAARTNTRSVARTRRMGAGRPSGMPSGCRVGGRLDTPGPRMRSPRDAPRRTGSEPRGPPTRTVYDTGRRTPGKGTVGRGARPRLDRSRPQRLRSRRRSRPARRRSSRVRLERGALRPASPQRRVPARRDAGGAGAARASNLGTSMSSPSRGPGAWRGERKALHVLRRLPRSLAFLRERPQDDLPGRVSYLRAMRRLPATLAAEGLAAPVVRVRITAPTPSPHGSRCPTGRGAVITADGMGEWTTAGLWDATGDDPDAPGAARSTRTARARPTPRSRSGWASGPRATKARRWDSRRTATPPAAALASRAPCSRYDARRIVRLPKAGLRLPLGPRAAVRRCLPPRPRGGPRAETRRPATR